MSQLMMPFLFTVSGILTRLSPVGNNPTAKCPS
jgi:hypothetical protein